MAKMRIEDSAHVSQRISERINNEGDRKRMVEAVKRLLTMESPPEAVGHYQWHLRVESIGRIVCRGIAVRTIYSFDESYPNSPLYKISGGKLVRG